MRMLLILLVWVFSAASVGGQTISGDRFRLNTGPCVIRSGSGAPSGGLGGVCDVYIRTDTPYTVYVKVEGSTWAAVTAAAGTSAPYIVGDVIYASSSTALGRLAAATTGQVLASNGTGAAPVYTATPSLTSIGGAANLTLNPTGDLVLGPAGADILPNTGYTQNLGALTNKYLTLHAAELIVETLVAQNTIATIGGRILVGPTTVLTSDLTSGATSIIVKHNQMANGDRVVMQANGNTEWMAIASSASGSGPYTYTVTRDLDSSGANTWTAGDAVFNTGAAGKGFIDLYSYSGILSGNGPTRVGNVRTGTNYNQVSPRWAIGNCNGIYGYSGDNWCVALGDDANAWVKIDDSNGIRMGEAANTYLAITPTGNATFSGSLTVGTGRNQISNTISAPNTTRAIPEIGAAEPGAFSNSFLSVTQGCNLGAAYYPLNSGSCYYTVPGTPANDTQTNVYNWEYPVTAGLRYEWSVYAGLFRAKHVRVLIDWQNAAGSVIWTSAGAFATCDADSTNLDLLSKWCRIHVIDTAPTVASHGQDAVTAFLLINTVHTGETDPYTFYHRLFFGEAGAAQTQPSPWAPGGTSLITGGHLVSDFILGNHLMVTDAANGTGNVVAGITGTVTGGDDVRFWAGDTYANRNSAEFRVTESGALTATSGAIGGWALNSTYLTATTTGGSFDGTSGWAATGDVSMWAGQTYANRATAPFIVYRSGAVALDEVYGTPRPGSDGFGALGLSDRRWGNAHIYDIDLYDKLNWRSGVCTTSEAACAGTFVGTIDIQYNGTTYRIKAFNVP
jgi:hypothetical protein